MTLHSKTATSRTVAAMTAALMALAMAGCKENFPVPLDPEPVVELDARLVGVWACGPFRAPDAPAPPSTGKKELFTVLEFRAAGSWYRIRTVGLDKANEEAMWDGYPSTVESRTLLNTWPGTEQSEGMPRRAKEKLALFTYQMKSADRLQFDVVTPESLKGERLSPAAELRKTLIAHSADPVVFKPWLSCTRARAIKS